jgi:RNA polymerase sigma-70 factor (ECF subfamily)
LVLTLYYFDDMKYADIADTLGMPLNTVKSHIRRGKERLAMLLQTPEQPTNVRAIAAPQPETRSGFANPFVRLMPRMGTRW